MKNYEEMTPQEQEEFMEAMTIADKMWDEMKANGETPTKVF